MPQQHNIFSALMMVAAHQQYEKQKNIS